MPEVKISPVNMEERKNLDIRSGDIVRVWQKIEELKQTKGANKKEVTTKNARLQAFEGMVLARKHGTEPGATFTVRRVVDGIGVERVFPLHSPTIDKIETLKRGRVRRAKLYYIRDKAAKEIRRQMRRTRAVEVPALAETTEEVAA
ncbi:MAG TPA: 50S ribosomal protein L19 [Candidatus Paceibacterota bacterium]